MKVGRSWHIVVCVISFTSSLAQSFEDHLQKIRSLPPREQIDYVIAHHYELYSANFAKAITLMQQSAASARSNGWKDKEAYCTLHEGTARYFKGEYDQTLPLYLKAYQLFDSLQHVKGLAGTCNELAVFYRRQKDTNSAFKYLDQAEALARKIGDQELLGTSYGHRAAILEQDGDFSAAEKLYEKVFEIRTQQNDSVGLGYALLDMANIQLRKNKLNEALQLIGKSTEIRKRLGDVQGVAINLVNTGETYMSVGDYKNAIPFFEQCLEQAISIGYADLVRHTYAQLSDAYSAIGDFRTALKFQKQNQAFNDSLYNIDRAKVIADLQTRYETEKKQQQIDLQQSELRQQNAELQRTYVLIVSLFLIIALLTIIFFLFRGRYRRSQQLLQKEYELSVQQAFTAASIQSQEEERKRFAQDLHDGLGQIISALRISLLSVNQNSSLQERVAVVSNAEHLLEDMHREIRAIAFNLMPHTLTQYGLVPALQEMVARLRGATSIDVRLTSLDIHERMPEVYEISLYRVVQEWTNNIIKFAKASSIEIQIIGYDNEIVVTIEDNGNGFDPMTLRRSEGNGWKNILSRVNLIKGTVDIDSQPDRKGTTLIIKVPEHRAKPNDVPATTLVG